MSRYKLIFTVPHSSLEVCKNSIFAVGAGTYPGGKYKNVCFEIPGRGQFLPGQGAKPNIGAVNKLEKVEEMRVEILCVGDDVMRAAVNALQRYGLIRDWASSAVVTSATQAHIRTKSQRTRFTRWRMSEKINPSQHLPTSGNVKLEA